MRLSNIALFAAGVAASATIPAHHLSAQGVRSPSGFVFSTVEQGDPGRAMLGITMAGGGQQDTLGVLVESVTPGSPAEKAGLEKGNRLQAINGVNLKLSRDDAADEYTQGINQDRLIREMRKVKAGDEVALDVLAGGRTRTVRVKTVTAESLAPERRVASMTHVDENRAAVGVELSATGSRRDTAGVFVQRVTPGGPAEKAGIIEGDRIASVNGVDLRVAREDAGTMRAASARVERLQREVGKLKPGAVAELVVVSGGRSRTVNVTTAPARDVEGDSFGFRFDTGDGAFREFTLPGGTGGMFIGPNGTTRIAPRIRIRAELEDSIRDRMNDAMEHLRVAPRTVVRTTRRVVL